ncbi:MAG: ribonuclease III [Bacteroidales bacterium]|nr:ribonuclease III [Bacteroidales bacterium]
MGKFHPSPYFLLYKKLGFFPRKLVFYQEALRHRSVPAVNGIRQNNERLEFLGDAILGAVISDIVFHRFKKREEGFLSNIRSKIVQRKMLNRIAVNMGLDKLIVSSLSTSTHNQYICGNALEALIGAIYMDRGYNRCKNFIETKIVKPYLNLELLASKEVNFKSRLIEWGQKKRVGITFDLVKSFKDKEHNQMFQTRIRISDIEVGIGVGYSKKESQQKAAKTALKKIHSKNFIDALAKANYS